MPEHHGLERMQHRDVILARLPRSTQQLLEMGACVGHRFDLGTLAELAALSDSTLAEQLWPAIEDGLLIPAVAPDMSVMTKPFPIEAMAARIKVLMEK